MHNTRRNRFLVILTIGIFFLLSAESVLARGSRESSPQFGGAGASGSFSNQEEEQQQEQQASINVGAIIAVAAAEEAQPDRRTPDEKARAVGAKPGDVYWMNPYGQPEILSTGNGSHDVFLYVSGLPDSFYIDPYTSVVIPR